MANSKALTASTMAIRRQAAFTDGDEFNAATAEDLTVRLAHLEQRWVRYGELYEERLGQMDAGELEIADRSMVDIERLYLRTKAAFRMRLGELRQQAKQVQPDIAAQPAGQQPQPIAVQVQLLVNVDDIRNTWELQRDTETPTVGQMLEFLDRQATARSNMREAQRQQENSRSNRFDIEHESQKWREHASSSSQRLASKKRALDANFKQTTSGKKNNGNTQRWHSCDLCKEVHQLYRCQQFLNLNFRTRKEYVRKQKLCENCLKRGHARDSCWQGPCTRCPGIQRHNSVLCPISRGNKSTLASKEIVPTREHEVKRERSETLE